VWLVLRSLEDDSSSAGWASLDVQTQTFIFKVA
jgi:hypothetical protein